MSKFKTVFSTILALIMVSCSSQQESSKAKYVFYFIGDGMSFSVIAVSEGYNAHINGEFGSKSLSFTQFPVMGMATSFSADSWITDSAAGGTALSSGVKTNNHFLGVTPDSASVNSIAYMIHEAGIPVGISSTVPVNHATPAAFYGHSPSRDDYYLIATQLPESGFEYFGGGGLYEWEGKDGETDAYTLIRDAGYTVASGIEEFESVKGSSDKIMLIQSSGQESKDLPFALDRKEGDLSLSQVVNAGIDVLYDPSDDKGFFLMSEGGKIDGAEHSNDAKAAIMETIDFGDAIQVAYDFYLQHPDQTLIVVTADHETGGIVYGKRGSYSIYWEHLDSIQCSKSESFKRFLTGGKEEVKLSDELTDRAHISWTTTAHNGSAIPVFAIGAGSELFAGKMDNTDIPKKICEAMGVPFAPVE